MSFSRTGSGAPARPSDGFRTRRTGEASLPLSIPKLDIRGRNDADASRKTPLPSSQTLSQTRLPSRVPQPSMRHPSMPQSMGRPTLDHQAKSGGSTSTVSSPRTHLHFGSGSSSSGRSIDDNRQPFRNAPKSSKSLPSPDAYINSRGHSRRTSSSSSVFQKKGPVDTALGIHFDRGVTESPTEFQPPEAVDIQKGGPNSPVIYPELDRYRDVRRPANMPEGLIDLPFRLATHDLPPPTPGSLLFSGTSAASASPSTRFSESPGIGTYSRDTTPTSISSQSPSLAVPYRPKSSKGRHNSPAQTRPPVSRRRAGTTPNEFDVVSADPHGLAAVRESLTSSSSNSTVREAERNIKEKKSLKRLPPPLPSPPPRKSSQNFRGDKGEGLSPPKKSWEAPRPVRSSSPNITASPPNRPSREGTPDMRAQLFGPTPIIRSNLSATSFPYERRGSEPTIPIAKTGTPIPGNRNASTSRLPLGREGSSTSQTSLAIDTKKSSKAEQPRPARTPSPHVGSSLHTRFPFFGRKKNSTDSSNGKDKDKKLTRKGPAAGTGHEGYGRIGAIRRRSGSTTNLTRGSGGCQTSQESLAGTDSFFTDRMNPVVISGGEIIENRNNSSDLSRTGSEQSLSLTRPSLDSKTGRNGMTGKSGPQTALWPSAMSRTPRPTSRSRRPSGGSDSDGIEMKSTLAFRRSLTRLRSSPDNPLKLPQPINTTSAAMSPMTSFDTSVMSDDSYIEPQREEVRGRDSAHPAPKKLIKRARSPRKWNLFSRSQNKTAPRDEKVTATVQAVEKKPVAFYTIMDSSEQEDGGVMDVQEALRSANVYGDSPGIGHDADGDYFGLGSSDVPLPAAVTPEPLKLPRRAKTEISTAPQLQVPHNNSISTEDTTPRTSGRPSRLIQVGRIPKVVSNRPEQPPAMSFSRPFRASLQLPVSAPEIHDPESVAKGPSPPGSSTPVPEILTEESTTGSATNFSSACVSTSGPSRELSRVEKEFIAFSPPDDSEGTIGTSCSSCSDSYALTSATAIIPHPDDPPVEDEIWDEYNDLIGEDNSKAPPSATSSKGMAFHLETYQSNPDRQMPMGSPTIVLDNRKASIQSKATQSSTYSADMTERIRKAFQPHSSPQIPILTPDPVLGGDQTNEDRVSDKEPENSARNSGSSRNDRKSSSSSTSSDDGSPLAQVNLRVGSMTVSKWLTFGHVMFSDVRHELIPVDDADKRHSILVIDGLGNDDWSFYAAETYPAATFYNLSPRAPLPVELQAPATNFPLSPPNHHQVQYLSHAEKFPFAPQSFTAMVYRFPVAAPESHYRNILTEARRVLKPGGYLELSILDVDLNNMGNRGRRTIRQLKEKIHETMPDTNLSSTADLIVRLLGKVGFSSIKAARVGVPASSAVTRNDNKGKAKDASGKKRDPPSLAEMMRDNSPMADEGITKMVGRVGQWWYSRCYEGATKDSSARSIWKDRALLSECTELGTSLKLMVCCAHAPDRIASF